jgi:hypothetical protein
MKAQPKIILYNQEKVILPKDYTEWQSELKLEFGKNYDFIQKLFTELIKSDNLLMYNAFDYTEEEISIIFDSSLFGVAQGYIFSPHLKKL